MGGRSSKNKIIKIQFDRSELLEFKEAFDMFDENGDGKITLEEIAKILRQLNQPVKEADLLIIMDEVDLDNSGAIDFGEFLIMMKRAKHHRKKEMEIREMFNVFDVSHTGKITEEDLKMAMTSIGEEFTDEEITEMMAEADRNSDGVIDYHEFHKLCKRLNL